MSDDRPRAKRRHLAQGTPYYLDRGSVILVRRHLSHVTERWVR